MKFLKIDDILININNITQIFIDNDKNDLYRIVVFYEGFDLVTMNKSVQAIFYDENLSKEEAQKQFDYLCYELNK